MELAPIVLFVYNRPWHCFQVIRALQRNHLAKKSHLIIYSDGPKDAEDHVEVNKVRSHLHNIKGFRSTKVIKRENNHSLSRSVISGVSEVIEDFGCAIILEDDLVTSKFFLIFINEALNHYKNEDRVISIHGYSYPVPDKLPETFFLRGSDCWGWATWKRGWDLFEPDGTVLLSKLKEKKWVRYFDRGAFGYINMLKHQVKKKNDSWAIRWHASAFLADKLTLYPGNSLVHNIGIDSSGTHCRTVDDFDVSLEERAVRVGGIEIKENETALNAFINFMKSNSRNPIKILNRKILDCFQKRF